MMKKRLLCLFCIIAVTAFFVCSLPFSAASGKPGLFSLSDLFLNVTAEEDEPEETAAEEEPVPETAGSEVNAGPAAEEEPETEEADTDDNTVPETAGSEAAPEPAAAEEPIQETELPEETYNETVPEAGAESKLPDNGIPVLVIYIDETEGHTIDDMNSSKDHSTECYGSMEIIVPEGFRYCDMDASAESFGPAAIEYIRGRGNSTWRMEKKPYKIKLAKKAGLLGMARNKHWVLLANYFDPTCFKNRMTGYLGDQLQMEYTPNCIPVDVVMVARKDGVEYARTELGNYLLAEQVRVGENRVEIQELTPYDTAPEDITGGYLVQFGSQVANDDPDSFLTERGIDLANDTPTFNPDDSDYTNEQQKNYIRNYVQSMEDALFGKDVTDGDPYTNKDGIRYSEYMDMDSAARYWLIQEASNNSDMYLTGSNYFYKKEDQSGAAGKLYWGPLWDFDQAWSVPSMPEVDYKGFHLKNEWLLAMVYDNDPAGFRETVKKVWPEVRDQILHMLEDGGLLDQYYKETKASCQYDYALWKDKATDYHQGGDCYQKKEDVKTYVRLRIAWMDAHILGQGDAEDPAMDDAAKRVTYIADGKIIRREYYMKNGVCEVFTPGGSSENVYIPEKEGYIFTGWKAEDGSLVTSSLQDITEDRVFRAEFVSEKEAVKAEAIRFRSDTEWCFTYSDIFNSHYTILPYNARERSVTWTSSDPNIASVDAYGHVKIHSEGTVTITAALKSGSSASYRLTILANPAGTVERFELSKDRMELMTGEYGFIDYRILPEYTNIESVYFHSEDPETAEVDDNGVVTGIRPGTTKIIAKVIYYDETYEQYSIEKTCIVTVTGPPETAVLTYSLAGGTYNGSTADITETYTNGDVIRIHEAPVRDGYTFLYWQGSEYRPGDSYTVAGDHTFTAVWEAVKPDGGDQKNPPAEKKDSSRKKSPSTKDTTDLFRWFVLLTISAGAAVWVSLLRRKPVGENSSR